MTMIARDDRIDVDGQAIAVVAVKLRATRHTHAIGRVKRGTLVPAVQALFGHEDGSTIASSLRVSAPGIRGAALAAPIPGPLGRLPPAKPAPFTHGWRAT